MEKKLLQKWRQFDDSNCCWGKKTPAKMLNIHRHDFWSDDCVLLKFQKYLLSFAQIYNGHLATDTTLVLEVDCHGQEPIILRSCHH